MSYTLGQAAKVVGMSKTSILRSIKAGRISAGRDEFGQWAIEPCELHRVYPALTEDTVTGNGPGERAVTGGETALAEANARAALAEARLFDFKTMLDDIREQRDRWQQQAERVTSRWYRTLHNHGRYWRPCGRWTPTTAVSRKRRR